MLFVYSLEQRASDFDGVWTTTCQSKNEEVAMNFALQENYEHHFGVKCGAIEITPNCN